MSVFKNKKVLITAGPTREAIDPVRYISNYSSGKMGFAIAESFLIHGAKVILVSGPVNIRIVHPNLTFIPVNSAIEMLTACRPHFADLDIAVFSAAVADYSPEKVAYQKIKKSGEEFLLRLTKNPDIAFEFGRLKCRHQVSVGFALETNDEQANAVCKLSYKNFDMVVLNSMNDAFATFEYDTNKVTIIQNDLTVKEYPVKPKQEVAVDILNTLSDILIKKEVEHPFWDFQKPINQ
jgi:phosphopantothenoylcysteine decarboxylase / phosphopantothenate---cysteine ligase